MHSSSSTPFSTHAIVALGANLGHRLRNLSLARDLIARLPGTLSLRASSIYETEPVGSAKCYHELSYLNAILVVETTMDVESWSRALHAIENVLHRIRTGERNAPRPIDVDLITFGDARLSRPDLTLPHPRATQRRFVMEPLAELLPEAILPGESRTVAEILRTLPSTPWVRWACDFPIHAPHRPLPFLPQVSLQALFASSAPLIRIPSGTHRFDAPIRLHSHQRIVCEPGAIIIAPAVEAIGSPTLCDLSLSGGTWQCPLTFHGVRHLRLAHLHIHGTLQLSRIDGFSLRHIHLHAPTAPDALTLGACTRYGSLHDITGHAARTLVALCAETAFASAASSDFASGPISHITLHGLSPHNCAPIRLEHSKSSIFALAPRALNRDALRLMAHAHRAPSLPVPPALATLFRPAGTVHVTSPFGTRVHPVTGEAQSFHAGIDLVVRSGNRLLESGICAIADGTVLEATDSDGPAGTCIALDHGNDLITRYFHLEYGSLRVRVGERVRRGTLLGYMGKTGRSTGEHCHFQIELKGATLPPVKTVCTLFRTSSCPKLR